MNKVINLSGKMSILGVTKISDKVFKSMKEASQTFYLIEDLRKEVEIGISKKFNASDAFITSSATAGIAQTIFAYKRKLLLSGEDRKVRVVLPIGHHINYGAPIKKIIEMGGAEVIGIGYSNKLVNDDLEDALLYKPDIAFYVSSHHAVSKDHISPEKFNQFFKKNKITTAIDIAAEENIWKFIDMKFDFTILSGSKAISGPTSGIVFTNIKNKSLLNYTLHNEGRAMKIGKENIVGLSMAIKEYKKKRDITPQEKKITDWCDKFSKLKTFNVDINEDKKRNIKRLIFTAKNSNSALQMIKKLKTKNIYCREYMKLQSKFEFDLRQVTDEELNKVLKIMKGGENG